MGYPMAVNLFKGLDASKTLLVCDVSSDAVARFIAETGKAGSPTAASVRVVENGFKAAQSAVSRAHYERGPGCSFLRTY